MIAGIDNGQAPHIAFHSVGGDPEHHPKSQIERTGFGQFVIPLNILVGRTRILKGGDPFGQTFLLGQPVLLLFLVRRPRLRRWRLLPRPRLTRA